MKTLCAFLSIASLALIWPLSGIAGSTFATGNIALSIVALALCAAHFSIGLSLLAIILPTTRP